MSPAARVLLLNSRLGLCLIFLLISNVNCLILRNFPYIFLIGSDVVNLQSELHFLSQQQNREQVYSGEVLLGNKDTSVQRYTGTQLWKVHATDLEKDAVKYFWIKYGAEIWNINQDGIDILVHPKNTQAAKIYLSNKNITFNIMIEDVESAIDDTYLEVNNTKSGMPWLEREGTLMNWNRYHDLGDITDFLHYCLENYPDIAQIITIGRTYNKRNIEVLRISNGHPENRAVFFSAGLQGRDWLSPAAVTYVISKLLWLWGHSSSNFQNVDWYFMPVVNPDGYQYAWMTDRLWAKNRQHFGKCYGVHLDRNFEYQWGGGGSSDDPCNNFYRGPKPFSETETKAVKQFLTGIGPKLDAYLKFGAYGQVITYPWGDADFITKNKNDLHRLAKRARLNVRNMDEAEYMVGSSYRLKMAQSGNMADWVQSYVNPKYVYSVYLKDQGRYGYLLPADYIVESGEEAFEVIKTVTSGLVQEDWIYVRHANLVDDLYE